MSHLYAVQRVPKTYWVREELIGLNSVGEQPPPPPPTLTLDRIGSVGGYVPLLTDNRMVAGESFCISKIIKLSSIIATG
jgi:hypothetical protein